MKKILPWAAGIAVAVLFGVLLAWRMAGGPSGPASTDGPFALGGEGDPAGREVWLSAFQNDDKIGWSHRKLTREDGAWFLLEESFLRINAMGAVQPIRVKTTARLYPDLTLKSFDFSLGSNLVSFSASGRMEGRTLVLSTGGPDEGTETKIELPRPPYLGAGLMFASRVAEMDVGESRSFPLFDPATLGTSPATVEVVGEETITVMGEEHRAKKVKLTFMGNSQSAWIGEDGEVLREKAMLGLRMERADRQTALDMSGSGQSADLVDLASVPVDVTIPDPSSLALLKVRVDTPREFPGMDGGRQTFADRVLTVAKETLPDPAADPGKDVSQDPDLAPYLEAGPFIRSDHPQVIRAAQEIVSPQDPPVVRAKKIVSWAHTELEKRPVFSAPEALATLRTRMGDCNEHAVLVAALARAARVPARMEVGLTYMEGRFYYHAWDAFYLSGQWITGDAVFGQFPADVTHLRFASGAPKTQLEIMGLLGRVNLEILEFSQ
ncbi:MAG: lasso peptide biosynthesis protein [Deltaproteobacteria bacterium]|nr:lasso peptide biosynthesis protein [Deltaproteobacteria bacterium]